MSLSGPVEVVALGGGHGLAATLAALRRVTSRVTAVVTVADDGGSSGRLRAELRALPPGDLRMAMVALAGADPWSATWGELFQYRFPGDGALGGHALGNLVLTALADRFDDPVAALDFAGRLLGVTGRVLPLSCQELDIEAQVSGLDPDDPEALREVHGQVAVATTRGRVRSVRLLPDPAPACPQAVEAVLAADWIVLGPGSLFSSVVPHLLVPELREALRATRARLVHVLNLAPQPGETDGFSPATHLEVLGAQAPGLPWEVVIADPVAVEDVAELRVAVEGIGARLLMEPVAVAGEHRHHPVRLAEVFDELFTSGSPPSATDPDDVFDAGALDQHDLSVLHDAEATWRP